MSFFFFIILTFRVTRQDGKTRGRYRFCLLLAFTIEPIVESTLSILDKSNQVVTATVRDLVVYDDVKDFPNETLRVPFHNRDKDSLGPYHYNVKVHGLELLEELRTIFFQDVRSCLAQNFKKEDYIFRSNSSKGPNVKISTTTHEEIRNIATLARLFGINAIEAPIRSDVCVDVILLGNRFLSIKSLSRFPNEAFYFLRQSEYFSNHCNGIFGFYRDKR